MSTVTLDFESLSGGVPNGVFTAYNAILEDGFRLTALDLLSMSPSTYRRDQQSPADGLPGGTHPSRAR